MIVFAARFFLTGNLQTLAVNCISKLGFIATDLSFFVLPGERKDGRDLVLFGVKTKKTNQKASAVGSENKQLLENHSSKKPRKPIENL